jgi:RHS repeat-associated protein
LSSEWPRSVTWLNELARYAQGAAIDEPLAELRLGTAGYYQQDGLGSVTSLSNSTGALANTYTYDAFGNLTASAGALTNPFQYTGRDYDAEIGLRYYRARYYDATTGRFLSEDPIGFLGGGPNFYAYVRNNPIRFRDPSGMNPAVAPGIVAILEGLGYTQAEIDAAIAYLGAGGAEGAGICAGTGICGLIVLDAGLAANDGWQFYKLGQAYGWWGQPRRAPTPKPTPLPNKCEKKSPGECKKQLQECIEECSNELR